MAFDLAALIRQHEGQWVRLLQEHINPSFASVLKTIGFDVNYVRGQGAYLFDDKGNRYIDCLGGYAVFACGRNHPTVRQALKDAMDLDPPNLPGVGPFRTAGILAKQLIELAPRKPGAAASELDTLYFCNSGTEANEVAIKYARYATRRDKIVFCSHAYHGLTTGSLAINGCKEFRDGFGRLIETIEIPFNDLSALEKSLYGDDVATFVVEPIQGKGVNIPADDYLPRAAELCKKHGTLLVIDEVQTGLGRTGKMFACEYWNVEPDIMTIAKALSGGYVPVGAVMSKRWIHDKVFSSMDRCSVQQVTFGMNELAMAAGLATLHVMKEERIVENAREVGDYLMAGLRSLMSRYEMIRDVRGKGLLIAIEFGPPKGLMLRTGWNLLHRMDQSLFCQAILMPLLSDHRILAQVAGHHMDVIKLIPPLVLSKSDADEIIAAFDATIGACHKFPGPVWEVGAKLGKAALKRVFKSGATAETPGAGSREE